MVKPWTRSNFLLSLWIELRFCMYKVMISVAARKILVAKTIRFFHPKIRLFQKFLLNRLCLNCHSTCPLAHRVLLSKRTSRLYESLQWSRAAPILHQQSDFEFWRVIFRPLTSLFSKISSFSNFPPHGPKPWAHSNFSLSLWIELRFCMCQAMISERVGKLVLAKTNWFFHPEILLFQNILLNSLCLNCHSTCPLPQRILLSKRTSRLYESLQWSRAAPILHQQSDFEFWRVIFRQLTSLFSKISSFSNFPPHGQKPWADYRFSHSLWIELRFCMHQAMTIVGVRKI